MPFVDGIWLYLLNALMTFDWATNANMIAGRISIDPIMYINSAIFTLYSIPTCLTIILICENIKYNQLGGALWQTQT